MTKENEATTITDTAALFEASRAAHEPRMIAFDRGADDAAQVLLVPDRMGVWEVKKFLDAYRERPERAKGVATHTTLESLIAHAVRNKQPGTAAFLSVAGESASLSVIYDYHEALSAEDSRPHWNEHGASYSFPLSPAFLEWRKKSATAHAQPDFAAFIEARTEELAKPSEAGPLAMSLAAAIFDADGADDVSEEQARGVIASPGKLRQMAKKIALRVDERAEESRDGNGNVTIIYRATLTEEQAAAGQPKGDEVDKVPPPRMFLVKLPVFLGGTAYVLPVRLSVKIGGARASWTFHLHRADLALENAQNDVAAAFTAATGLPVFRGTPETMPK